MDAHGLCGFQNTSRPGRSSAPVRLRWLGSGAGPASVDVGPMVNVGLLYCKIQAIYIRDKVGKLASTPHIYIALDALGACHYRSSTLKWTDQHPPSKFLLSRVY